MYDTFGDDARRALQTANQVALRFGHQFIAPEHILLGVLAQPGLAEICENLGVAPVVIIRALEEALGKMNPLASGVPLAKRFIEQAMEESQALRHNITDAHHLLLGILRLSDTFASQTLRDSGLDADWLRDKLAQLFPSESNVPELPLHSLVRQFQSHPDVRLLDEQLEELQRKQSLAISSQDFHEATKLRDQKVVVQSQLTALLGRLRTEATNPG